MDAWPFLVSRNKESGFKVVVAPQFLNKQDLAYVFNQAAGGDLTPPERAFYREVHGSEGAISLVFRVVWAKQKLLGKAGDEDASLRDGSGRPIELIEGIVLWEKHPDVHITERDLQFAHEQIIPAYQKFWKITEETVSAQSSTCFPLSTDAPTGKKVSLTLEKPLLLEKPILPPSKPDQLVPETDGKKGLASALGLSDEPQLLVPDEESRPLPPVVPPAKGRNRPIAVLSLIIVILIIVILILLLHH